MQTDPNMYDVPKASYKNSDEQATSLSRFGYNRDEELSNDNQQAYFNPEKKKLLYGDRYPQFERLGNQCLPCRR